MGYRKKRCPNSLVASQRNSKRQMESWYRRRVQSWLGARQLQAIHCTRKSGMTAQLKKYSSTYFDTDCHHHGSKVVPGVVLRTESLRCAERRRTLWALTGSQRHRAGRRKNMSGQLRRRLRGHSAHARSQRARGGTHVESGVAPPSDAETFAP
jgi:hypothetical protein